MSGTGTTQEWWMEREVAGIAERLAQEFSALPWSVVVDAVCTSAAACREVNPFFVEQAARAALGSARNGRPLAGAVD
jgi:hypothetical protein